MHEYDLEGDQLRFNQLSDTCTFVIETEKDGSYLLRIHGNKNRKEIDSELGWLSYLHEKIEVAIPTGIDCRNGSKTVSIDLANGDCVFVSVMHWVEGEHVDEELSEDQVYKEGVLLAKLHTVSRDFQLTPEFARPIWGEDSFKQSMTHLKEHYQRFLTDEEFELYQLAADKILNCLAKLDKNSSHSGIIYGDLHQGNIVFYNGDPRPIDFGRCGFGYYLYDIAHTILGLYPAQRELVIKGYESLRKLEGDWLPTLESFTVMVMIENYSHHASDPREIEGLKAEQPYAIAMIKNYLNGTPFLFHSKTEK
ncbi:Ser/Thr protein kinase RdoA (MazF antagonist) [Brevibacillus sp. AG162]|uniref:phosphotransferase enzyme family protein n=1 Tax=Brevibacillus sp. AG162 TaxID=2572910 RepID=UPI00116FB2E1|nr:phosphotransferase [Brevibacillus sp. AG162]TQK53502.1 Ser/Thr protein kinase RdoA (MazF antagonist) [Brevibacillus sp. AG162]